MYISKLLLLLLVCAAPCGAAAPESGVFTPYFSMTLGESLYAPSEGQFFSGGTIDTRLGLLAKLNERHSFFGLYSFRYDGPAFQPQDGKQFEERSLDHSLNLEYRRQFGENWRLRPAFAYTKGYRRSGSNEAWETGLYNMNSLGGQLAVDRNFTLLDKNAAVTAEYLYRSLKFPNYTDLLREFENAGPASELGGGLQDQNVHSFSLRAAWEKLSFAASYSLMNYSTQTVIGSDGVYGNEKQKDKNAAFELGYSQDFWIFGFSPAVSYGAFRSNQSFLRYKYIGAAATDLTDPSSDVTLIADAYSHNDIALRLPFEIRAAKNAQWAFSGSVSLTRRTYCSRPPRDTDNNYLSGHQRNTLARFSLGARKRLNDFATMSLTYTLTNASSNNKFEKYLPYNYTGHNVGISYSVSF